MNKSVSIVAYSLAGIVIGIILVSSLPHLFKIEVAEPMAEGPEATELAPLGSMCEGYNESVTDQCPASKGGSAEPDKASLLDVAFIIALGLIPSTLVLLLVKYWTR